MRERDGVEQRMRLMIVKYEIKFKNTKRSDVKHGGYDIAVRLKKKGKCQARNN
jgi:hypothetical protein